MFDEKNYYKKFQEIISGICPGVKKYFIYREMSNLFEINLENARRFIVDGIWENCQKKNSTL